MNKIIELKNINARIIAGLKLIDDIEKQLKEIMKDKECTFAQDDYYFNMRDENRKTHAHIKAIIRKSLALDRGKTKWSQRMKKWQCGTSWTFYNTREEAIDAFNIKYADEIKELEDYKQFQFTKHNVTATYVANITLTLPKMYRN